MQDDEVALRLRLYDEISRPIQHTRGEVREFTGQLDRVAPTARTASVNLDRLGRDTATAGHRARQAAVDWRLADRAVVAHERNLSSLGNTMRRAVYGAAAFGGGRWAYNIVAGSEQAEIGISTLTGSAEEAQSVMAQLRELDRNAPLFGMRNLAPAAQQLLAYGFAAKDVVGTLGLLQDASQGRTMNLEMLTRNIGQIQSLGRAQGDELRSLSDAGVPALRILGNQWGKTTLEVQKMVEAGTLTSDKVLPSLFEGMRKGTNGINGQTAFFAGA